MKQEKNKKFGKVYEIDASQLKGKLVDFFIPEDIAEVQRIVKESNCVVARGGGTGLVGGCVPEKGVVIDLSKLNKVLKIFEGRRIVEVEAGIVLGELNEFLEEYGFEFPVNPSSHEVCTIGGMIATNAVGSRALKYGRTSQWVDWIEIVDAGGNLVKKGKTELSDFAGMEGITGVIVRVGLRLIEKKIRTADIVKKAELIEVINFVKELKRNQNVSMIEFFDKNVSNLLGFGKIYTLFVEYESEEGKLKGEEYLRALELRDEVYPLLAEKGYNRIEDPKVFLEKASELIMWLEENKIPVYGHISVGILHPCFSREKEKKIPEMIKFVKKLGGQVSGEHGIGLIKKEFLDENDKRILRLIKNRNDPINKFNPGKIL
jgi:glycolate oxidase